MQFLKANMAVTLKIGPFLDDTDGKTAETELTIAQADVRISKNGADIIPKNEATSCTHDELGIYGCPIDTTDTNTEGRLQLWVHKTGALPVFHEYTVVNANVYDSLFVAAGTDFLRADIYQIGGVTASAVDLQDLVDTGYDPDTHKVQGVVLVDTTTTNTDMRGTDDAATEAKQDTIDTVVDGIQTDLSNETDGLGALKTLIDTADGVADAIKAVTDNLPNAGALSDLATIKGYTDILDHATNGLAAIKAEVEGLAGETMRGTNSAALATALTTHDGKLDTVDTNVDAILVDTGTTLDGKITTVDTVVDAIKAKTDNLPSGIPKNVALSNFEFLMIDSSDHISYKTGLTVTAQISKDGGVFANCTNSVSEIGNGVYKINLTATEMNANVITLKFTAVGTDQRIITILTST